MQKLILIALSNHKLNYVCPFLIITKNNFLRVSNQLTKSPQAKTHWFFPNSYKTTTTHQLCSLIPRRMLINLLKWEVSFQKWPQDHRSAVRINPLTLRSFGSDASCLEPWGIGGESEGLLGTDSSDFHPTMAKLKGIGLRVGFILDIWWHRRNIEWNIINVKTWVGTINI